MNGKIFLVLYLIYLVALVVGYVLIKKHIEKKKLLKKLAQEAKLRQDEFFVVDESCPSRRGYRGDKE